jgi:hypothetical protein
MRRVAWLWFAAMVAALVVIGGPAQAATPRLCTRGMAQSLLQSLPVVVNVQDARDNLRPRRVDALGDCVYTLFRDQQHFTFSEDDYFVGRLGLFDFGPDRGSHAEAVAGSEMVVSRLWLAEVAPDGTRGELVEQPLVYTAVKNVVSKELGPIWYQQRGAVFHLPPGDYVSILFLGSPGEPDETLEVFLHILPAGS